MSTLEGAVPLGIGITKLRLWDELHRAHCESLRQSRTEAPTANGRTGRTNTTQTGDAGTSLILSSPMSQPVRHGSPRDSATGSLENRAKKRGLHDTRQTNGSETPCSREQHYSSFSDWFMSGNNSDDVSPVEAIYPQSQVSTEPPRDSQGVLMPPPPPKPGPSRRKPPPLVARIKAKARRAKRKQQKAEYRRRLFLAHMVQATRAARQQSGSRTASSQKDCIRDNQISDMDVSDSGSVARSAARHSQQQALSLFPECLGVDLASFVEVVFDTDAQSSEITAPSDISDDDLAWATRTEIETRKKLGGADVIVPKGVYRWMVARDFAERWPQKVQGVRKNPWPGLEDMWGLPTNAGPGETLLKKVEGTEAREEEPLRWQSGQRSKFIRRKEKGALPNIEAKIASEPHAQPLAAVSDAPKLRTLSLDRKAVDPPRSRQAQPVNQAGMQPDRLCPEQSTRTTPTPVASVPKPASSSNFTLSRSEDVFGAAELALASWDWNTMMSCSRSSLLPSAIAGTPIRL